VGGGTRIAGFLLAVATFILLMIGTGPIAYIPVMVVSALILVLGIDLVKEALWDTRHRVSRMEYITIVSIMVMMTAWDFVIGVLFGIVVSCFFFVVQNSQRRSIRACYTGESAISTVRRPAAHRAYIREVSKQTRVLRLQGFLFFGTITHVEETLRNIVEDATWQRNPVRFVVVDLSLVVGVDMSAAEAFVRVQRLLAAKGVVLVFCGVTSDSLCGKALSSVGILQEPSVEVFETLNDAMEWTENAYLRAWFRAQKSWTTPITLPGRRDTSLSFDDTLTGSPRQMQLRDVGERTIAGEFLDKHPENSSEPYNTLLNAFSSYHDVDQNTFKQIAPYFERFTFPDGFVLWENNDAPDGLYIIESGILRASYKFAEHSPVIEESMVSGTLAGELSALSGMPRNARVVVEQQAVLWKLSLENIRRLEAEQPHLAQIFVQLVLKAAKVDTDILLAALATR
jgi:SulP family sulfate permease